jgi:uncharacterized membrane protein YgaE (UPF0421/DUF939 family)
MKESIYKQHEENTDWLNRLDFYKEDIKILTKRLEEIATKNSATEVLSEVERFQNQFIIQNNNIDEIKHLVKENESLLKKEIESNPVAVDHRKMEYHEKEKELVEAFEKNFNTLREDYNTFSSKWM